MNNRELIDLLNTQHKLESAQWVQLFETYTEDDLEYAMALARSITVKNFGKTIYFRGIVEFSNYCKNDCYYCGIRASNKNCDRYRLTKDEILEILKKNVPDCPEQTALIAADNCGGVPGKAITIAKQGEDIDLKRKVAEMFLEIPEASYCKILNDISDFMNDHKADAVAVATDILLLIDDLMRLKGIPDCKKITFTEQRLKLEKLAASPKTDMVRLGKCVAAVKEFLRALDVNANYDAASCAMLLKIHEELK